MKKSILIVVLLGLFISCSSESEQLRVAPELCDCITTTQILEDTSNNPTILSTTLGTLEDTCSNDGEFTSVVNSNGTVTEVTWSCTPK